MTTHLGIVMINENIAVKFVNPQTSLVLLDGRPEYVLSTARNLDSAFDAACQWWGQGLDCGTWQRADDVADLVEWACYRSGEGVMALSVEEA